VDQKFRVWPGADIDWLLALANIEGMLPGNETGWLIGSATVLLVVFLLVRFNRHKLGALWERWENMPWHVHALTNSVLFGLLAVAWKAIGREFEFRIWGLIAAIHLAQGIYLFLNRNKPVDNSPAAQGRRIMRSALWSFVLLLPLAWMAIQAANGQRFESAVWAFSIGGAAAGAFGLFDSMRKWKALEVRPT
jgi:hypothetical protein